MALFSPKAKLQQIEFPVTVIEQTEEQPPIVIHMRAIPERKYEQLAADWIERPDRRDLLKIHFNGATIGNLYAEHIVLIDPQGVVQMSGMTLLNYVRLYPQAEIDDADRERFYQAGDDGLPLTKQEFIGLCTVAPAAFAVPMLNKYKETLDTFSKTLGAQEEERRKNSLNGRGAPLALGS